MTLLLLEALGAGLLLIGIIWWTMFAGRPDGNPPVEQPEEREAPMEPGKPNKPGKPGSPDSSNSSGSAAS
ncbi:MAG: hypothetical protein ORN28_00700 [Rhodoferax sp.]|nr:hypothetical protein [Rhodoferax sp.]